jgi:Fe-S cluster biogenesis protein NfuA
MEEEDLVAYYAAQAKEAMAAEANRRIKETVDVQEEERLRNVKLQELIGTEHLVPALLARLGPVRAALDGHGGGVHVDTVEHSVHGLDFVLDLTGACLSCGAAPGTLSGIKGDLENDVEIWRVRFSSSLLDTFDELGREFILTHGDVEFVS